MNTVAYICVKYITYQNLLTGFVGMAYAWFLKWMRVPVCLSPRLYNI